MYFSVNLERGQYNCFHCCSGCPYSGGIVDLFCLFNGLDPKKRQEANKALANALDGKPVESRVTLKYQPEPTVDVKSDEELDKVYRAVLNELTLKPEHRNNLLKRGLTNEVIDKCLYRSVPERWVSVFAKLKSEVFLLREFRDSMRRMERLFPPAQNQDSSFRILTQRSNCRDADSI